MAQRPGPTALPQLPPAMAWWEQVGGPGPLALPLPRSAEAGSGYQTWASRGSGASKQEQLGSRLHPAMQARCQGALPCFWGLHACRQRSRVGWDSAAGLRVLEHED